MKWITFSRRDWTVLFTSALIASVVLVASNSPAEAVTYNRDAAVAYAKKYACNLDTSCRNKSYRSFSNDCTSFASQSVHAGGIPEQGKAYTYRWYYYNGSEYSRSWSIVYDWRKYMVDGVKVAKYLTASKTDDYTAALKGDVILYDFGKGGGWAHLSVVSGYGKYISFTDPNYHNKNYNSVTGGYGDKIAQHGKDRDGAPWNWAYWTERDKEVRKKQRVMIIRMK